MSVPPIKDRLDLPRYLVEKGLIGEGVEVGVLFGEYSAHLLEYWPGVLHMVDPWEQQQPTSYLDGCNAVDMRKALEKTKLAVSRYGERAEIKRAYSLVAAQDFKDASLDFVFLDGNHNYDHVKVEMADWIKKIVPGGILSGHDFYNRHTDFHDCGVEQAVREFCAERTLSFYTTECTSWWVEV